MTAVGIVVLVVGVILLALEAHVPTAGLVGSLGVASLVAGAALAAIGAGGSVGLAVGVAGGMAVAAGAGVFALSRQLTRARSLPPGGVNTLLGHVGVVRSWHGDRGRVFCDGALWHAHDGATSEPIAEGDAVVIDHVHGLTLRVRKAEEWELQS
jgi:membrane-bound ClpP family serine protease